MDTEKLAITKAAIGIIGARTSADAATVLEVQDSVEALAATITEENTTALKHTGALNITVFNLGKGLKIRINADTGGARLHMEQFDLE